MQRLSRRRDFNVLCEYQDLITTLNHLHVVYTNIVQHSDSKFYMYMGSTTGLAVTVVVRVAAETGLAC